MHSQLQFFFCLCAAATVLVTAKPYEPNSYMLSDVAEKSLCPMKVEVNKNEKRIPRFIKYIKCDVQESPSSNSQSCSGEVMSCVQLMDFAPVQYLLEDGSFKNSTVKVPVGCTCMEHSILAPVELPS